MVYIHDFDPVKPYHLPPPEWEKQTADNLYESQFHYENLEIDEHFFFRRTNGTWKISWYLLTLPVPGQWVTNKFQELADLDKNGFLDNNEQKSLYETARPFFVRPHPVSSDVDIIFDRNEDKTISRQEWEHAVKALFFNGMKQFQKIRKGWVPEILDHDGYSTVDSTEFETVYRFMLTPEKEFTPYPVNTSFGRILDSNHNGTVSLEEIKYGRDELVDLTVVMSFADNVLLPESRSVSNLLDEYGDSDLDGNISAIENDQITAVLEQDRSAVTDIDHIIDKNNNGTIDTHEITMVLQDTALGLGFTNKDSAPPYRTSTAIEKLLDSSKDGQVNGTELNTFAMFYTGNSEASNSFSLDLKKIIDTDGDGIISTEEKEISKNKLLFPHPVKKNDSLDRILDINGDGMVSFPELGITGGFTEKGIIPTIDRRISVIRQKGQIEEPTGKQIKPDKTEINNNVNLAVLGVKANRDVIDQKTITGLIMFLENAFVNSKAVNVIDRKDTNLVLDEMNFQLSGLVNKDTIVEVGNLTCTSLLAVSEITNIEGMFYLNVKILNVGTAEIIKSVLSQANKPRDFLDMCETAVDNLF